MPGQELLESAGDGPQLTPMRGRITDARHLLLSRTVVREGRAYRQGVVLDVEELTDWLSEQGLGNGLAKLARVGFTTRFSTPDSVRRDQLVYRHRFADPFDALTAHLTLLPLRSTGTATYVYTLCALLLAAIVLGLASLYRMVSVIVGFAERRSNFVAAVSHELKTPLTAIRMYGEMLRDGIVSSEAKRAEYYRHITSESERLSRLINNVLEFSRLEQGNREMILTTGSIGPTIREVAELLRPHAQAHGFELRLDIATDLPHVRFEPDAVMQILWNLVDNAVKYAGESAPKRITVSCLGDAGSVRLAVRDSGPGVAPRHLTKIFEPFYRDENELTRRSRGTGLGLALVRSLAERLGARVNGRNLKDGGFEVEIVFRAAPE
jgi:signal transduction histidine kinase